VKCGHGGKILNAYSKCSASVKPSECAGKSLPFQSAFKRKKSAQAATTSGSPGQALTRAGVKK